MGHLMAALGEVVALEERKATVSEISRAWRRHDNFSESRSTETSDRCPTFQIKVGHCVIIDGADKKTTVHNIRRT